MSYLRYGQDGYYVDIPNGSNNYIYDNGDDINGWSYGEFAALIAGVVDEIGWDGGERFSTSDHVKQYFTDHFGGWDDSYDGGIAPPERGEIFCQCVDSRIDGIELTDSLQEAVQEWVDEYEAMVECDYCGKKFRPHFKGLSDTNVCDKEECDLQRDADRNNVPVRIIENERQLWRELHYNHGMDLEEASDRATDYLFQHRPDTPGDDAEKLVEDMDE